MTWDHQAILTGAVHIEGWPFRHVPGSFWRDLPPDADTDDLKLHVLLRRYSRRIEEVLARPVMLFVTWDDDDETALFRVFAVNGQGMPAAELEQFELPFPRDEAA
jgi:hypothetical protein